MAAQLSDEIRQFNQEAYHRELTSALIIRSQLKSILDDRGDQANMSSVKGIVSSVDESLKQMLAAKTLDNFLIYESRLKALVEEIQKKCELEDVNQSDLEHYKQLRLFSKQVDELEFDKPEELSNMPLQKGLLRPYNEQINALLAAKSEAKFEEIKRQLQMDLHQYEKSPDITNKAGMALVLQNLDLLSDTRHTYLEHELSRSRIFKDIGWAALGAALVVTVSVLSLALPALVIPGLVLGTGVLSYSLFDVAQEINESNKKEDLGERILSNEGLEDLMALHKEAGGFDDSEVFEQRLENQAEAHKENRWISRLSLGVSGVGLFLAAVAFVAALPVVGFGVIGLGIVAGLSLAVVAAGGVLLGYNKIQQNKELQELTDTVHEQIESDKAPINEFILAEKPDLTMDSTALIFKEELGHSPTATVTQLLTSKPEPSDSDIDENDLSQQNVEQQGLVEANQASPADLSWLPSDRRNPQDDSLDDETGDTDSEGGEDEDKRGPELD